MTAGSDSSTLVATDCVFALMSDIALVGAATFQSCMFVSNSGIRIFPSCFEQHHSSQDNQGSLFCSSPVPFRLLCFSLARSLTTTVCLTRVCAGADDLAGPNGLICGASGTQFSVTGVSGCQMSGSGCSSASLPVTAAIPTCPAGSLNAYVSPTGVDAVGCGSSPTSACASLAFGLGATSASSLTVHLAPGLYPFSLLNCNLQFQQPMTSLVMLGSGAQFDCTGQPGGWLTFSGPQSLSLIGVEVLSGGTGMSWSLCIKLT